MLVLLDEYLTRYILLSIAIGNIIEKNHSYTDMIDDSCERIDSFHQPRFLD